MTQVFSFAPAGLRVLLFEDNAMDAALMRKFLQSVGVPAAQIYHADTIPSALQILTRENVDVCLADYHLPPHTGLDLMDEARRCDMNLPFIVVTALDDRAVDESALAHGAFGFLVKGELTVERLERSIRYTMARYHKENALNEAAYVDSLTGLPNRAAFLERLSQVIADNASTGGMVGVALFNINGTKFINEAFGRNVGDDVLRAAARRLGTAKRLGDMAARLDGDEFAVIITGFPFANRAVTIARALADVMTGPIGTPEDRHNVTLAGGVAAQAVTSQSVPGGLAERLLLQASQAMFTAKQTARMNGGTHVAIAHMH